MPGIWGVRRSRERKRVLEVVDEWTGQDETPFRGVWYVLRKLFCKVTVPCRYFSRASRKLHIAAPSRHWQLSTAHIHGLPCCCQLHLQRSAPRETDARPLRLRTDGRDGATESRQGLGNSPNLHAISSTLAFDGPWGSFSLALGHCGKLSLVRHRIEQRVQNIKITNCRNFDQSGCPACMILFLSPPRDPQAASHITCTCADTYKNNITYSVSPSPCSYPSTETGLQPR
jgi:hypothetical protein